MYYPLALGFRNNNNRLVYPQREICVKSPWKSTVSRPSHDLIVFLSISLLFLSFSPTRWFLTEIDVPFPFCVWMWCEYFPWAIWTIVQQSGSVRSHATTISKRTRTKSERYRYQTKDTADSERYYTLARPWKRKVFDNKWESERGEKEIITRWSFSEKKKENEWSRGLSISHVMFGSIRSTPPGCGCCCVVCF